MVSSSILDIGKPKALQRDFRSLSSPDLGPFKENARRPEIA